MTRQRHQPKYKKSERIANTSEGSPSEFLNLFPLEGYQEDGVDPKVLALCVFDGAYGAVAHRGDGRDGDGAGRGGGRRGGGRRVPVRDLGALFLSWG